MPTRRHMKHISDACIYCEVCTSKMLRFEEYCECSNTACKHRVFFTPGANNGLIITNPSGLVMLSWRLKEPTPNCWEINGGFAKKGESGEQAAVREAVKELGGNITLGPLKYVTSIGDMYPYQEYER